MRKQVTVHCYGVLAACLGLSLAQASEPHRDTIELDAARGATPRSLKGRNRVLILVGLFQDAGSAPPLSPTQIGRVAFKESHSTHSDLLKNSEGKFGIVGSVKGPYILPFRGDACDQETNWLASLRGLAVADNVNISAADHIVHLIFGRRCNDQTAWGLIAGKTIVIYPYPSSIPMDERLRATLKHEIGHNLGLYHSNSLYCRGADWKPTAIGKICQKEEYGDTFSAMGNGGGKFDFNGFAKAYFGWLDDKQIKTVTGSGVFKLKPMNSGENGLQVIKIPRKKAPIFPILSGGPGWQLIPAEISTAYYLEYRKIQGQNSRQLSGLRIIIASQNARYPQMDLMNNESFMIDAVPNARDPHDGDGRLVTGSGARANGIIIGNPEIPFNTEPGALPEGKVFHDPENNLTIRTLRVNGDEIWIRIVRGNE